MLANTSIAVDGERHVVHISEARRYARLRCIECEGVVVAKKGEVNKAHFSHITSNTTHRGCNGGTSEGFVHLSAKRWIAQTLASGILRWRLTCSSCSNLCAGDQFPLEQNTRVTIHEEHPVGPYRVDVFAECESSTLCIEIDDQHRTNSEKLRRLRERHNCKVVRFAAKHVLDVWAGRSECLLGENDSVCDECTIRHKMRQALYGNPWCVCAAGGELQMPPREVGVFPPHGGPDSCHGSCYDQAFGPMRPFEHTRARPCSSNCKLYLCPVCEHAWLPARQLHCTEGLCVNCAVEACARTGVRESQAPAAGYTAVSLPFRASPFSCWRVPQEGHCVCTLSLSELLALPMSKEKIAFCRARFPFVRYMRMPWGKFRGNVLSNIPKRYLQCVADNHEDDEDEGEDEKATLAAVSLVARM